VRVLSQHFPDGSRSLACSSAIVGWCGFRHFSIPYKKKRAKPSSLQLLYEVRMNMLDRENTQKDGRAR
jgi:hypothetical protein